MAKATNTGTCELCGHITSKGTMSRHLAACAPAHDAPGEPEPLIHLRFESPDDKRYWIHVEARAATTLEQVDSLLRRVWLECCGHLSAFRLGRLEIGKGRKVGELLALGPAKFLHEYDFGSTTVLAGQVLGLREGSLGRRAVRVTARNDPFVWPCDECGAAATLVCPFCLYDGTGLLCETHAESHEHAREEVYLPVVNSPRMGVCGYTG